MKSDCHDISTDLNHSPSIEQWLSEARQLGDVVCEQIPFAECEKWSFKEGILCHDQGCFFSIVGIRADSHLPELGDLEQPIILQPEIGILGFVVRETADGWDWLLQAKSEPGNIGFVQGAPSVQATYSNYMQKHGGLPTPMLEYFLDPVSSKANMITDIEQSEQGDRFLGKYNRNSVVVISDDAPVPGQRLWKWFPAASIRNSLHIDFGINTDARSVLFCSDWRLLVEKGESPFSRWRGKGGFGESLCNSFETESSHMSLDEAIYRLALKRKQKLFSPELCSLYDLKGWSFSADEISCTSDSRSFDVRAYETHCSDREVEHWCQPLLVGLREIVISMVCTRISGVMHFYLRFSPEIGFREVVQLAPSLIDDTVHCQVDWVKDAINESGAFVHAYVKQSDEGGRFMESVAAYSIIEISDHWVNDQDNEGLWLTLSQLKSLVSRRGLLTNESRSVLSLLLAWD
jgi:oxidase EvaA